MYYTIIFIIFITIVLLLSKSENFKIYLIAIFLWFKFKNTIISEHSATTEFVNTVIDEIINDYDFTYSYKDFSECITDDEFKSLERHDKCKKFLLNHLYDYLLDNDLPLEPNYLNDPL